MATHALPRKCRLRVLAGIAGFLIVLRSGPRTAFCSGLGALLSASSTTLYAASVRALVTGLLTIPLPILALVLWLRWLEERDSVQETPKVDPEKLRLIKARENEAEQNHMGSVVLVKPGILRAVVLRAGLWGLGYLLRVMATDGYLASMRTIHFAHWAIAGSGGQLIFFSNFDGSWESYLDDFIEKAHQGLTLAWTNGVGFPYTRFLVNEGASRGRLFKAWARHSMAEGLFWFRAYQGLSVNQIERQYRIAKRSRQTGSFERGGKGMGVGPVTRDTSTPQTEREYPGNWRLAPKIACDVQGLVVSGYAALPSAVALFLKFGAKGGAWLKALRETVKITPANERKQKSAASDCFHIYGVGRALTRGHCRGCVAHLRLAVSGRHASEKPQPASW